MLKISDANVRAQCNLHDDDNDQRIVETGRHLCFCITGHAIKISDANVRAECNPHDDDNDNRNVVPTTIEKKQSF